MGLLWFSLPFLYGLYVFYTICVICALAGNQCKITVDLTADCSHLKLSEIPSDLPSNIKALDLSHNQLKQLPAANLSRYGQIEHLDVGYNTLHQFEPALCEHLPLLKILNLQHNEFSKISEKYFIFCINLIKLQLNSNGISSISGNPFEKQQNLLVLDMSHNKMTSTELGNKQQLWNLKELNFSNNKISKLKKEALEFLGNTSLQKLELSSNPLKAIDPDSFHAIRSFETLVMQKTQLGPTLTGQLCSELAGTRIRELLLNDVQLSKIYNRTFSGLADTNLTVLDISGNTLSRIENNSFVYLQHLELLNMENNQVSSLNPNTFLGLSKVKSLNLRHFFNPKESKIEDLSFQGLNKLEYLNMEDNKLLTLTENTFTNLTSLKYLSLCDSTLNLQTVTNMTFSSLSKSPLLQLNLTKTGLTKLEYGAFSCLEHLKVLDLGLNRIDQVILGHEFLGLNNIEMIYLSYNNHLTLTSSSFMYTPSLQRLFLRKAALTFSDPNPSPFKILQNLTILDLSNNNIANIQEDVFEGLSNLRILNLQHNNLARLWKNANPGGPVLFLKGLHNLEILSLLSNGFDEIPSMAFKGLSKLNNLELGENNVCIIPPTTFDELRSLSILDLHKNLITSVEKEVFQKVFNNLQNLSMGGNPFDCTCESIAWFANWLNATNASVTGLHSQYICNTPTRYHGISVELFDSSPCKEFAPFMFLFTLSFTVILSFMLLVLLIEFQGWRIQFYWTVAVNRILGFKEIDPGNEEFDYDAYIIHAKQDNSWVENNLIPLEEDKNCSFQFCFEERDFDAGISNLVAIVNGIKKSRKIIFVITQHFLNDPWCKRFKIHHAVQQAIEQSRDSIILIFLEDIPDYKLNLTIHLRRGMFQSRCILDWPAQRERVNAFHQKLKIALGSSNIVK
ncbi:toll-like receptor 3 [Rhinophrynus dorsalis]